MRKPAFTEKELDVKYSLENFRTNVPIPHFHSPINARENFLHAVFDKEAAFMPDFRDMLMFHPRIIPDNRARSLTMDGGERTIAPSGKDMFGTEWVYVETANGSMVRPGHPLFTDANEWEDKVVWPDIDSWDWKGQAELSCKLLSETELAIVPQLFSGYFERMISLMDMENACMAMIDDSQEEALKAFLDKIADLHIAIIDRLYHYFPIDGISIHDDWGSKRAPIFSLEAANNILVPAEKKVADHIHELGLFYDFHCCGQVEIMVPAMLEIGVDVWSGQPLNDKKKMHELYGDKILLGVEPPEIPEDMPEDEVERLAEEFVTTFITEGKPSMFGANCSIKHPHFYETVYRLSRERGLIYGR